jgi:hypothetical protein
MRLKFEKARWAWDQDGCWLSILVPNPQIVKKFVGEMNGTYSAEVKKWREHRSLDANAYAWVLMGKLAAKLRITKTEVYRQYIREIGDNFEPVPVRNDAVDTWKRNWEAKGDGWVCDIMGPSKLEGYTVMLCYYGSSTYDTRQMSVLLDAIIADCKAQGIETATPEELARMKEER